MGTMVEFGPNRIRRTSAPFLRYGGCLETDRGRPHLGRTGFRLLGVYPLHHSMRYHLMVAVWVVRSCRLQAL